MCIILKYCYFNLWCLFSFSRMLAVTSVSEFLLVYSTLRGWFCLQVMKPFVEALDYVGNIQAHSLWLKHHTGSHVWWTDFVCRFWSCISSGLHREHPGPQRKPCLMDCFCLQVLKLYQLWTLQEISRPPEEAMFDGLLLSAGSEAVCRSSGLCRKHSGPQPLTKTPYGKPCLTGWFCLQVLKLFVEALDYTGNIQAHSLFDYYTIQEASKEAAARKASGKN